MHILSECFECLGKMQIQQSSLASSQRLTCLQWWESAAQRQQIKSDHSAPWHEGWVYVHSFLTFSHVLAWNKHMNTDIKHNLTWTLTKLYYRTGSFSFWNIRFWIFLTEKEKLTLSFLTENKNTVEPNLVFLLANSTEGALSEWTHSSA